MGTRPHCTKAKDTNQSGATATVRGEGKNVAAVEVNQRLYSLALVTASAVAIRK